MYQGQSVKKKYIYQTALSIYVMKYYEALQKQILIKWSKR